MDGRVAGVLFGTAYGDALGAPTEFVGSVEEISRRWPDGPPMQFRVTDDTQMMLAVADGLVDAGVAGVVPWDRLTAAWIARFVAWSRSPDNDRAPGVTCLRACGALAAGTRWQQATIIGSKGCGANMRVQPIGLLSVDEADRGAMAQLQAALTHGHPTGLAASELTAVAIARLREGMPPDRLVDHLRAHARAQREVYHAVLGDLHAQAHQDPAAFIARGWDECLAILDRLDAAVRRADRQTDPCLQTGAAWIAEEALATGLLCFLLYPDDARAALRRAAITSGDSDSIACLTGAFAGASLGIEAFPDDWRDRIEYREHLTSVARALGG